ncbi:MAG: DUF86 domain-containing protein [Anaerolinea sp.]|nr:DUF86 domain-containing protein [Anaerolinea sp.]
MTPQPLSQRVVTERLAWAEQMLAAIRRLPLHNQQLFFADERNIWTADSCLRRALEAVFDLGRHILAKQFGVAASEYKETATQLQQHGVFDATDAALLRLLAGYRNRLVHFYHEVSAAELYEICSQELGDIEKIIAAYRQWLLNHSDALDKTL